MMPLLDIMAGFTPRVDQEELNSFAEEMNPLLEKGFRLLDDTCADYEDLVTRIGEALSENSLTDEEVRKLRALRLRFLEKQDAILKMKGTLLKAKNECPSTVG
jgi:uncharacterized protein YwgA